MMRDTYMTNEPHEKARMTDSSIPATIAMARVELM